MNETVLWHLLPENRTSKSKPVITFFAIYSGGSSNFRVGEWGGGRCPDVVEFLGLGDCFDAPSHILYICICSESRKYNTCFTHCTLTTKVYAGYTHSPPPPPTHTPSPKKNSSGGWSSAPVLVQRISRRRTS